MVWSAFLRAAVSALAIAAISACDDGSKNDRTSSEQKPELDQTATELPPGIRERWFAALDKVIDERLGGYKGRVIVADYFSGISFVPVDLLEVQCGGFIEVVSVVLPGGGVEGVGREVVLLSSMSSEQNGESEQQPAAPGTTSEQDKRDEPLPLVLDEPLSLILYGRPTPPLGVGKKSPAALQLMTDLCRHLIDRIEEIAKSG